MIGTSLSEGSSLRIYTHTNVLGAFGQLSGNGVSPSLICLLLRPLTIPCSLKLITYFLPVLLEQAGIVCVAVTNFLNINTTDVLIRFTATSTGGSCSTL